MPSAFDYEQFISPFSWRYGSAEMRAIWSEVHKRRTWRRLWVALARAQMRTGLVTAEQVADLEAHAQDVDIARAGEIEAKIQHDLMAEVQVYAEQCAVGGGIIHLGATSMDIEDNTDALRLRDSLDLIVEAVHTLLATFAQQIERLADHPVMAFTHLQPAEPTTMGYRLALYAQDLLEDAQALHKVRSSIRGKGFKGAVGTAASYMELLDGTGCTPAQLEQWIMESLDLPAYPIDGQTYPRKQDWQVLTALSGLAGTLYKFAFDLRLLQSPVIGEWGEPFGTSQVGSSAMPFKRNPISAEKIDSLARLITSLVDVAWNNHAHSLLERTLDDSANRREMLPVAILATDEILRAANRIVANLRIDETAAAHNLERYGGFAAIERVLMRVAKAGADRQQLHEHLREQSMLAWAAIAQGQPNPLVELLTKSSILTTYLSSADIRALLDASAYVGDAPERARQFAQTILTYLKEQSHAARTPERL
jgi:adenylosuccinate lyase